MFNNSKIRFRQKGFNRQLKTASGYKRNLPKKKSSIKLKGAIISLMATSALVYIFFIPNFLSIKHIEVKGAPEDIQNLALGRIKEYQKKNFINGQGNILLFSKAQFSKYLIRSEAQISSLKITKKLKVKTGKR